MTLDNLVFQFMLCCGYVKFWSLLFVQMLYVFYLVHCTYVPPHLHGMLSVLLLTSLNIGYNLDRGT